MPLLVAQRNTHQGVAVLDRCHRATSNKLLLEHQQPLDFTMSKYKPTSRHQLYRQIYSAEDSLQYDHHKSHEDQGKTLFLVFIFHFFSLANIQLLMLLVMTNFQRVKFHISIISVETEISSNAQANGILKMYLLSERHTRYREN